ncbi:MAG TPA: hypothetical protein DCW97_01930 [Acidobacteria bacterium]|nr:hypothetical protein [Acidobacteriota bacterium]
MNNKRFLTIIVAGCFGLVLWLALGPMAGLARAEDGFFDSNGVKIYYVTEGEGEPVVLIHGWMADSSMWGRDQQGNTKLDSSVGFKLIAFDCRGHGKSDKPHDQKQYGTEMAADVVRLLDHLHLDKAHLVGYSSGAFIAGKVAATYPERVLSVVYAGQAPVIAEVMKRGDFSEVESFARAVENGDLGSYLIDITPADRPKPTREQAEAVAKYLYGGKDVIAFATSGRSFPDLAVTVADLEKCQAPVLFIRGENESQHVKSKIKTARELLGRGEIKVIPGGDHITTLIQPEFTTSLLDFLRHGHLQ